MPRLHRPSREDFRLAMREWLSVNRGWIKGQLMVVGVAWTLLLIVLAYLWLNGLSLRAPAG